MSPERVMPPEGRGAILLAGRTASSFNMTAVSASVRRHVGESRIGLVARSGRAGERLRWVVRLPGWLRVGLLADAEAVRRITAFTLYCLFVPLAFLLELAGGGATAHPAVVAAATVSLAAQAAAT